MARWTRTVIRHRKKVLALWAIVFVVAGMASSGLGDLLTNRFSVRGPNSIVRWPRYSQVMDYELEYGVDAMEMHTDAISPGDTVLLVDDLIATGGTAMAAIKLLRKAGAKVAGAAFLVCLPELQGDSKLAGQGINVSYLVWFAGH